MQIFIEKIHSRGNLAYIRWGKEIRESELKLKEYLLKERSISVQAANQIVSSSQESILLTRKGWALNEVIFPIKSVLFKIYGM